MKTFKLDNGKYLTQDFGKYRSGLLIITDVDPNSIEYQLNPYINNINQKEWNEIKEKIKKQIPFDGSIVSIVKGQFRVNKKGNKIFDLTRRGDILIRISWGGSFNKSRGVDIEKVKDYKYYNHASSNRGGVGYDYIVLDENFNNHLSEDDF